MKTQLPLIEVSKNDLCEACGKISKVVSINLFKKVKSAMIECYKDFQVSLCNDCLQSAKEFYNKSI